jgi:hypothetical protein
MLLRFGAEAAALLRLAAAALLRLAAAALLILLAAAEVRSIEAVKSEAAAGLGIFKFQGPGPPARPSASARPGQAVGKTRVESKKRSYSVHCSWRQSLGARAPGKPAVGCHQTRAGAIPRKDRLLANGVAASAARRKTGGLQWGGFPWGSGARNGRKFMGGCPPQTTALKNEGPYLSPTGHVMGFPVSIRRKL